MLGPLVCAGQSTLCTETKELINVVEPRQYTEDNEERMKGKTVTCKDLAFYLRFEGDSEP